MALLENKEKSTLDSRLTVRRTRRKYDIVSF
jgi:hypothetical protein